jgi:Ni/Co efflux regulator RcnB
MSMKKLLVIVALGTVIAAPAFAQQDPNDPNGHRRAHAAHQQRSTVPPGGIYYGRNNNLNPDFQLGGSRWKTLHRARPASRTIKKN